MAKGDIPLHPKFGVNPMMVVCAWCGTPTGEIALLGAGHKGEAPRQGVLNDAPCDTCKGHMARGITIIEAVERPSGGMADRTGRWCVVSEEGVRNVFDDVTAARLIEARVGYIDKVAADEIGLFK